MSTPERSKILWRCRRGMREMDLLFNQYVSDHYEQLENDQKQALLKLLDENDPDIMRWIMGHEEPPRSDYVRIIKTMRELKNRQLDSN